MTTKLWTPSRRQALATMGGAALAAAAPFGASAQTPSRGGHFKFGISRGATGESLDPTTYTDWNMYNLGAACGNFLVEIDSNKVPQPELAESWEAFDGATRWVFKLRQGVEFHNGKTLTAADVIYTVNRHRGEDSKSPAKPFVDPITDIRAQDDHTIEITLSSGDANLPISLALFQMPIVPEGFEDFTGFIGTGGYILQEWEPGVRWIATRNPNYWKSDRAWLDSYEQIVIIDPTSRTNALLTGQVNAIDRADPKVAGRFAGNANFQIIENVGTRYTSTAMDTRVAPFGDVNVRRALKWAMDRQAIVDRVNLGYGVIGNDHPVPPNDPNYNSELEQTEYDPDKAKFYLKEAGLDSVSVDLSAADTAFPGAVDAAVLFREAAKAANIDVNAVREPNDGYWSNVWLTKPFCMVNWGVRPTPEIMFTIAWKCGAPWADARFCNDRFEALLAEVKVTTDQAKRKEMLWEMQAIQHDQGGNHVFAFPSDLDIYTSNIGGAGPDAMGVAMGTRVAERVWMTG
jgi:peptide/nickel transport system substrate-binding protein